MNWQEFKKVTKDVFTTPPDGFEILAYIITVIAVLFQFMASYLATM